MIPRSEASLGQGAGGAAFLPKALGEKQLLRLFQLLEAASFLGGGGEGSEGRGVGVGSILTFASSSTSPSVAGPLASLLPLLL